MHNEILNKNQSQLLPMISAFRREYYLVGGTAIALYIGHRRSIDFDLFKMSHINHTKNLAKISEYNFPVQITRRVEEQMNLIINDVKITFFQYPFDIPHKTKFEDVITLPSLLDLAAMKAYALSRRSKWKDYVDLFFVIRDNFTIEQISIRANDIFGHLFSEKLFRAQLSYFSDIDYTEQVDFLVSSPPTNDEIRDFLVKKSIELL